MLDAQFLRELVNFGFQYAKLNPTPLATATEDGTEAFLATLWQSNSTEAESIAVKAATGKLSELFAGFDTPEERLQWLKFATTLVQAVGHNLAPEETVDPVVVSALIELGAVYAQLNPTASSTEPPLNFFLDTLWQAQDEVGLQTGAEQLQAFIQDVANPTRLLKLATGLLRAMESLSLELPPDAQVLNALLELGKAYAVLDPIATTPEADEPLNFFLDTLWQAQDDAAIQKGTEELKQFLEDTNSPSLPLLKFGTNLLKAVGLTGQELQEEKQDSKFLGALIRLGSAYAALKPTTNSANEPLNFFLDTLWQFESEVDIQKGSEEFLFFIQDFDVPTELIDHQYKLLTALKMVPSLQDVVIQPSFIKDMAITSKSYATLELETEHQYKGFLHDLWKVHSEQELKDVAISFQNFILNPYNGYDLYASATRPGPGDGPEFNRCYDLVQAILTLLQGGIDLVFGEDRGLRQRYYEMQRDVHGLYQAHVEALQGNPQAEQRNIQQGLGTWTGHQERYNRLRQRLRELYDEFNENCDDMDKNYLKRFEPDIEILLNDAETYAEQEPPDQPDPNQISLPSWFSRLGIVLSGGALVVTRTAEVLSGFALRTLQAVAEAYGLILKFSQ
ncbi:hypothetical protein HJG54_17790 [Leptolyngbya sp. NK1-12]|uniref:Uncharacterized protein n=1 Tax=Leptolyngbya sp. NK1-12 TaxID=2547451 RepID=A0AA96WVP1_9CYAN|nr:hypothetical protein [Leptolyngbya sp. NK1-12]WNZ24522.1 hypothetical protein HJG54_17790 [Leptolyngbya sp. NK1-12]